MIRSVYTKWLWDARRSMLGWTLAIVVVGCGYAAFWPTINDPTFAELIENYPSALLEAINYTSITNPAGYLNATVYGLVVAVLMAVFAIAAGTRIIAGEEEAGILDLTLSQPVSRPKVALQRFAALATAVAVMLAVFLLAMLAIAVPAQFDTISVARFVAMHVHLWAFTVLFGALSFAVGAASGRRSLAWGLSGGVAVLAYAASGIIPQAEGLQWVRDYSAFTWLNGNTPLSNGLDPGQVVLMVALSAVFVAVGTLLFARRDIAT
jgi:ABC-2 type transport system permease protein